MSALIIGALALALAGVVGVCHVLESRVRLLEEKERVRNARIGNLIIEIDDAEIGLCAHGDPNVPTPMIAEWLAAIRAKAVQL